MLDDPLQPADAGLIPVRAAGRADVFLYGTLAHDEVLAAVLGRPIVPGELAPAVLAGYRREAAIGASYPVLVADATAEVAGRLLRRPSLRELRRINHYEADEYLAEELPVSVAGLQQPAWVFLALAAMVPSGRPWELEQWAAAHLPAFHQRIVVWMRDAPG
ncbi:MAG: gamma-glutamylcyclotransferase family protein [Geminicoccaceae bacterium]